MTSANNHTSIEDINHEGQHLTMIAEIVSALGLTMVGIAPEIAAHCDEESGKATLTFAREVLKPVLDNIVGQIEEAKAKLDAAEAEVKDLENLLKSE